MNDKMGFARITLKACYRFKLKRSFKRFTAFKCLQIYRDTPLSLATSMGMSRSLLNIEKRRRRVNVTRFGEQGHRLLSFSFDVLPERHGVPEVACEPSVDGSPWPLPVWRPRSPSQGAQRRSSDFNIDRDNSHFDT
jgi:hypothetical protein